MWALYYFCVFITSYALGAEFTLPGECPNVKIQENLDYTKFSGSWYNVASYASDGRNIYDCASLEFQEDNLGYTLRETYVDIDLGNRTQKSYFARVDPTFDAGSKAQFIVSHEDGDKVLQFPFFILSTDYKGYAIAYTCKTLKKKQRTHYVFTWVLSRNKEKLQGETLKNVEDVLSKYTELAEHRQSFVLKDFSDASCTYTNKFETDFFTSNFCKMNKKETATTFAIFLDRKKKGGSYSKTPAWSSHTELNVFNYFLLIFWLILFLQCF